MEVAPLPSSLSVLVRGWVHGNAVIVAGARPAIVDTGYHTGVDTLLAQYQSHIGAPVEDSLGCIALTHTHSDHAGGVAAIRARAPVDVLAHSDTARLVDAWDTRGMWLDSTGQELPRYAIQQRVRHGDTVQLGDRPWTVLHTAGHATGGISLFQDTTGVLITGDALWEDGFGILNPWIDGPAVFEDARTALDRIEATGARTIIPGHGAPFVGLAPALTRARSRLQYLEAHPDRLQHLIVRSCAGFLQLARPGMPSDAARAVTMEMARSLGLPEHTLARTLAEVFGQ